jgi:hypothetical protein
VKDAVVAHAYALVVDPRNPSYKTFLALAVGDFIKNMLVLNRRELMRLQFAKKLAH